MKNKLRVSKIEGYNIKYDTNGVVFVDKEKNEKGVEEVVNGRIDKKISGIKNKKLYKDLKEEDKSNGKYELIRTICEQLMMKSVDLDELNRALLELREKDFPQKNIHEKKISKEEIISYSLSEFGREMCIHNEIARLMSKEQVEYNDISQVREKIAEYKINRKSYLENAKKGITKSIEENIIKKDKGNRYKDLLTNETFEDTIKKFDLELLVNEVNARNKEEKSIYDIYKEHHKTLYGTRENPIEENRADKNIQNLDRLIREYLEIKKLNAKYINDNELNFEKVKSTLKQKVKNKEINNKLNNKSLNSSKELIDERIKSNMFKKLNYYSYEASNFLFKKRINIAKNNDCLHFKQEQIDEVLSIELNKKEKYNEVFKDKETKQVFIESISKKLNSSKKINNQPDEVSASLDNLKNLKTFDSIDKQETENKMKIFNSNYAVVCEYIVWVQEGLKYIDFGDVLNINDMKELSNIENENNRCKLNKKFIGKDEMGLLVYDEFQRVREFRNLLNHSDKSLNISAEIDNLEIDNILEQYFDNIRLDLEHSGLYKVYNDQIKELFLNSMVSTSEKKFSFTPSFKEVVKNVNFNYQSKEISKEYYNLLKKIYNNVFIVDKCYQEKGYSRAVNKLNTYDVKKGFGKSKSIELEDKLLELQDRYNTRLNLKNEEGNEKYVLSNVYAYMFNDFLESKNFEVVQEGNTIEIIDIIFNEFKNTNKSKFIRELEDMNSYFFYLLKNLSEKSRNSLEHQLKSYSKNYDEIVGVEIDKILPLFKYFKNYDNKTKFSNINVELFFTDNALEKRDNNGSDFEKRLYQENRMFEEKQLSLHISNMFNSIYINKIIDFFENTNNEEYKITSNDVENLYRIENNKLDLNEILRISDNKEKNDKLIIFNENKNIKSKAMLEDIASINYILNDIYAILLKFATTSGILLSNLFSDELVDDEGDDKDIRKEFLKMENSKKNELLNTISDNGVQTGNLKILINKLKEDMDNNENHDLIVIRNAFCHYNKELFELSILDMINLIRYLCSFDRKQKNNVTRAIINYLSKKSLIAEFQFNDEHFIYGIVLKNKEEKNKPYYSEYKLKLIQELIKY